MDILKGLEYIKELEEKSAGRFVRLPEYPDTPVAFTVSSDALPVYYWMYGDTVRKHVIDDFTDNSNVMGWLLAQIIHGRAEYTGKKLQKKS